MYHRSGNRPLDSTTLDQIDNEPFFVVFWMLQRRQQAIPTRSGRKSWVGQHQAKHLSHRLSSWGLGAKEGRGKNAKKQPLFSPYLAGLIWGLFSRFPCPPSRPHNLIPAQTGWEHWHGCHLPGSLGHGQHGSPMSLGGRLADWEGMPSPVASANGGPGGKKGRGRRRWREPERGTPSWGRFGRVHVSLRPTFFWV